MINDIRKKRVAAGLSQKELGEYIWGKDQPGLQNKVSRMENGLRKINTKELEKIVECLGIDKEIEYSGISKEALELIPGLGYCLSTIENATKLSDDNLMACALRATINKCTEAIEQLKKRTANAGLKNSKWPNNGTNSS